MPASKPRLKHPKKSYIYLLLYMEKLCFSEKSKTRSYPHAKNFSSVFFIKLWWD